jgi:hypothetical protein
MTLFSLLSALLISSTTSLSADPLIGRYTLDAASSDDPSVAVESVVQSVGRMGRGRARARLTPMMTPPGTLEIAREGDAYLIDTGAAEPLRVVPGADPIEIRHEGGEQVRVTAERDQESLLIHLRAPRATRTQRFTPTDAGLQMSVVWDLEIADEPVVLRFRYDRGPQPAPER